MFGALGQVSGVINIVPTNIIGVVSSTDSTETMPPVEPLTRPQVSAMYMGVGDPDQYRRFQNYQQVVALDVGAPINIALRASNNWLQRNKERIGINSSNDYKYNYLQKCLAEFTGSKLGSDSSSSATSGDAPEDNSASASAAASDPTPLEKLTAAIPAVKDFSKFIEALKTYYSDIVGVDPSGFPPERIIDFIGLECFELAGDNEPARDEWGIAMGAK